MTLILVVALVLVLIAIMAGTVRMTVLDERPRANPPASHASSPGSVPPARRLDR